MTDSSAAARDLAPPPPVSVRIGPSGFVGALDLLVGRGSDSVRVDGLVGALRLSTYDGATGVWTSVAVPGAAVDAGVGHPDRPTATTVPLAELRRTTVRSARPSVAGVTVTVDASGVVIDEERVRAVSPLPAVPESVDRVDVPLELPPDGPSVVTVGGETRLVLDQGVIARFRSAGLRAAQAFTCDGEWFLAGSGARTDGPVLVAQVASYAEGTE